MIRSPAMFWGLLYGIVWTVVQMFEFIASFAQSSAYHLKNFANSHCISKADLILNVYIDLLEKPNPLLSKWSKPYYKYVVFKHYMGWQPHLSLCKAYMRKRFCLTTQKRCLHFELRPAFGPENETRMPVWVAEHTNAFELLDEPSSAVRFSWNGVPTIDIYLVEHEPIEKVF